jgi:2-methylisocitrate lyase-like PEP mutase family enzyme
MVPTGRSPEVEGDTLREWGFDIAIYPVLGMAVATAALEAGYRHLEARRHTIGLDVPSFTMDQLNDLVGFPEVWDFERRYASRDA